LGNFIASRRTGQGVYVYAKAVPFYLQVDLNGSDWRFLRTKAVEDVTFWSGPGAENSSTRRQKNMIAIASVLPCLPDRFWTKILSNCFWSINTFTWHNVKSQINVSIESSFKASCLHFVFVKSEFAISVKSPVQQVVIQNRRNPPPVHSCSWIVFILSNNCNSSSDDVQIISTHIVIQ